MNHLNPPSKCDLCAAPLTDEFSDARILLNGRRIWANTCPQCASSHHAIYGTGQGQRYVRTNSTFVRVEG